MAEIDGATAGERSAVTCTVTVVEGLIVNPSVVWLYANGSEIITGGEVTVGNPDVTGRVTTLNLIFSPLHTSHGGEYTCRASVNIPEIDIADLHNTDDTNVTVTGKLCCCNLMMYCV